MASQRSPITDSPWFWLLLFSLFGLAALVVVRPKFERREQIIETKFHARERAFGREAKEEAPEGPTEGEAAAGPIRDPAFTLGPIAAMVGAVALVSLVGVLRFIWQTRPK